MAPRRFGDLVWPAVVAHRGASATHPENTLDAFEAAVAAGADGVELDVRLTADGVPVVLHDADVAATTDGRGPVHELPIELVRELDASGGRGLGLRIPTLREALEVLTPWVGVDIEVKNSPGEPGFDPDDRAVVEVLAALDVLGVRDRVLISSFNPMTVARARGLAPDVATGLLTPEALDPRSAAAAARDGGHAFVLPAVEAVRDGGPAFVGEAHAAGLRVGVWTVDDPEEVERLFSWGVDMVVANDPGALVGIRDAARASRIPRS